MKDFIKIDGSMGEGGGQVLRTSLSLSLVTGTPFRIINIRSGRKKPGLLRQHLTAVMAAGAISGAEVRGAEPGSLDMEFIPGKVVAGDYAFSVGTAGSTTLVLQTVLPALMIEKSGSNIALEGGTHNPFAPPYDFIEKSFVPLLRRMGPQISCSLLRPGYYPAGGGSLSVSVRPAAKLGRLDINERGGLIARRARAIVSRISPDIAARELAVVRNTLHWEPEALFAEEVTTAAGPGNVLLVELMYENVTEIFTGFGERGLPAERVARKTVDEVREYLASKAPVGRHLADQLLVPVSIAGGGSFRTLPPTQHTLTNMEVIRRFLNVGISCEKEGDNIWRVTIG